MSGDAPRSKILAVAGECFAAEGYQNTTVRAICRRAGVNIAAVNYYFGDKERLYIEAVKDARNQIEARWPLPDWGDEVSPTERLRSLIQTFLRRILCPETAAWQMQLIVREIFEPTRACEEMVQEGFKPFFQVLLTIIRGLAPPSTPSARLHQLGFSVISQCVFYRAHQRIVELMIDADERQEHFQADRLAEAIFEFSLAAIVREPQALPTQAESLTAENASFPAGDQPS